MIEKKGHTVIPFSVQSIHNVKTEWEDYFLSPIDGADNVYFEEYRRNILTLTKIIERSFYSVEGFIKSRRIAKRTQPDLVYILHFLNKMSPSIIEGFKSRGLPIVVRLSDFGIMCPQGLFLHDGIICEKCIHGSFRSAVKKKCVKNSTVGSLIKCISWSFHRLIKVYEKVDAFICPSAFTMKKMIEGGFPEKKIFLIPTFVNLADVTAKSEVGEFILYFGRLSKEKGVDTLVDAYNQLPEPKPALLIIADIENHPQWVQYIRNKSQKVHFLPFQHRESLFEYIKKALFVVVPSICYENMPNTILEAFANGKPVIASNIGSLPELVKDGETGFLFEPGNDDDLRDKVTYMLLNQSDLVQMGKRGYKYVEKYHSPEKHYNNLFNVFRSVQ